MESDTAAWIAEVMRGKIIRADEQKRCNRPSDTTYTYI